MCERNVYKDEDSNNNNSSNSSNNRNNRKRISYSNGGIFDEYDLQINTFYNHLEIRCQFLDYDIEDNPINRAIVINKKAAMYLIIDLIKYLFTGRI